MIAGLHLLHRASDGSLILASYHPPESLTWWWILALRRAASKEWSAQVRLFRADLYHLGNPHAPRPRWWHRFVCRDALRQRSWMDHYRLPFGWTLTYSAQDYHRREVRP